MTELAVLSLHSSPLTQPGTGDSGGMNVYVRELAASLAQSGVGTTVYVRSWDDALPHEVAVEPGFRVVHIPAGPATLTKEQLPETVDAFTGGVLAELRERPVDVIHANYWLSGVAGHRLKHQLDLPLVSTFHTLARVKAETGDPEPQRRIDAEAEVVGCSDVILANSVEEVGQLESLYGADPKRIEIVPPGVEHAFFSPGERAGARRALGLGDHPVLLFVGRIQPLKGLPVAIGALAELRRPDAELVVVGGPSGADGDGELRAVLALADQLGVRQQLRFVPPQPHHLLSTYYRAADVVLVPSRSESFGLVALEAAACGIPVVAAAVGGLRTLVDDGRTGFLLEERDPAAFAAAVRTLLASPERAARMGADAAVRAQGYTWSTAAARLRRIYGDLSLRSLVDCAA
ncbi:glycosyltransferase [Aquihabitans sp. McL0605]|uniref:glycosyltransferase n=1 Tax=Aquihabitans sp. McL0605 TaxID=3415671 RepID=UPI003CFB56FE